MKGLPVPTYDLAEVQQRVRSGYFRVTASARATILKLSLEHSAAADCVLALTAADFYKTMESEAAPGLWQDVYRPVFGGLAMYLKLQISFDGFVVVISFKEL
jgi:motility quorum-sensing regulator/GCU-specific mRNA interferase toxin